MSGKEKPMQEQQKQFIKIRRINGEPYSKIARELGLSINTVKSFCRRSNIRCEPLCQNRTQTPSETMQVIPRCKNCGIILPPPRSKQKLFCSDRCRYTWWNHHREQKVYFLTCKHCKKKFISLGSSTRKYCSKQCMYLARNTHSVP